MELNYLLTNEDYIEFNRYHMDHSETVKKSIFIQRYVISLVYLVIPFVFSRITEVPFWIWMTTFGVVYILWVFSYPKRIRRLTEKRIRKMLEEGTNEDFLGEQKLSLTEDGIEKKSATSERKNSWKAVQRIEESENLILIYVSAVSAYLVPKKAFSDETEKERFLDTLKERTGK